MIYHYTSLDSVKRTNAAFLMGAFMIVILKKTVEDFNETFKSISHGFSDYRDASYGPCSYKCTVIDYSLYILVARLSQRSRNSYQSQMV